jgi:hypothetical protein
MMEFTTFRKQDLCPSSCEVRETSTLLVSLKGANVKSLENSYQVQIRVEAQIILLSVCQSVLISGHKLGLATNFFPSPRKSSVCRLVVRLFDYRPRGLGYDSWRYHIFLLAVDLERGPLSLARINEELFQRSSSPDKKNEINGCCVPPCSPRDTYLAPKVWTKIGRPAAVISRYSSLAD